MRVNEGSRVISIARTEKEEGEETEAPVETAAEGAEETAAEE